MNSLYFVRSNTAVRDGCSTILFSGLEELQLRYLGWEELPFHNVKELELLFPRLFSRMRIADWRLLAQMRTESVSLLPVADWRLLTQMRTESVSRLRIADWRLLPAVLRWVLFRGNEISQVLSWCLRWAEVFCKQLAEAIIFNRKQNADNNGNVAEDDEVATRDLVNLKCESREIALK